MLDHTSPARPLVLARCAALWAALALSGCGTGTSSPARPTGSASSPASRSPASLWAMAPEGTVFGVVLADRAGPKLARIVAEVRRLLGARSSGRAVLAELDSALGEATAGLPFDAFDLEAWEQHGVDWSRGAALFMDTREELLLAVLPFSDVEAVGELVDITVETIDGASVYRMDEAYCDWIGERYACSEELAVLRSVAQAVASGSPSPLAEQAAQRPAELAGDIELFGDARGMALMESVREMRALLTPSGMWGLSLALDPGRGAARAHLWFGGEADNPVSERFVAQSSALAPGPGLDALGPGATQVARLHLPLADLLDLMDLPALIPIPGGLDLRSALFENMTGELMGFAPSGDAWAYRLIIPVRDPDLARRTVTAVCELVQKNIAPTIEMQNAGCRAILDLSKIAGDRADLVAVALLLPTAPVLVRASRHGIEVAMGSAGTKSEAGLLAGSAMTREMVRGPWAFSLWAMNFDVLASLPQPLAGVVAHSLDEQEDARAIIDVARWLAGQVYDTAMIMGLRPDGLHMGLALSTFAADPREARAAHERAQGLLLDGRHDAYRDALARTARDHAATLAGRHARALLDGVSVLSHVSPVVMLGGIVWAGMAAEDAPEPAAPAPPGR